MRALFPGPCTVLLADAMRRGIERRLTSIARLPRLKTYHATVMDPIVARLLVERGMDTKQNLIDWCSENARLPAREYWDDQWVQTLLRPLAVAGVEPYASRLKAVPDEIVQMFEPSIARHLAFVISAGDRES
jgi:hypothetical protein